MKTISKINGLVVDLLTKDLAEIHIDELIALFNQIPQVEYTPDEILAEKKGDRILYGKWEHSLAVLSKGKIVGVITGYERESENNEQYPDNTMYINELAVNPKMQKQGIGAKLIELFLKYNKEKGFVYLKGDLNFSVQTNAADWNQHVIKLYETFGFVKRTTKKYENRTDVVMGLNF